MKFFNEKYGVTGLNSSQFNMAKLYICTRCYEYEMNQLKSTRNGPDNLELVNNDNESVDDMELRLLIESLHMRDGSNVNTPQSSKQGTKSELLSENELAVSHN